MKSPNRGFLTKSAYSSTELVKFHRCEGSNPSSPTRGLGDLCALQSTGSPRLFLPGGRPPGPPDVGFADERRGSRVGDGPPDPPVSAAPTGARVPASPVRSCLHLDYLFMLCVPAGSCSVFLLEETPARLRGWLGWSAEHASAPWHLSIGRNGGGLRPVAVSSCPAAHMAKLIALNSS